MKLHKHVARKEELNTCGELVHLSLFDSNVFSQVLFSASVLGAPWERGRSG